MTDGTPEQTSALVRRARSGDRDAFAALIEQCRDGVYAQLLIRTGDAGRSSELAHEAFVTAWQRLDSLAKPASFRSWVTGIGLNLARRRRKQATGLESAPPVAAPDLDGADALARQERDEAVRRALVELPENYRDVLVMHYYERRKGREIGRELGISEGAVHMTLLRARKALARKLKAFAPEGGTEP
jgi:RNA polymerase sigma factor (sigma-70 family)